MTLKQKRFAKEYVMNGGNGKQAALKVYNTTDPHSAETIASDNLRIPEVKQSIDEIANSQGVTPSFIIDNFKRVATKEAEKYSGDAIIKANVELARILNLYPGSKHTSLNVNMKGNISELNFTDVKKELKVIDSELANIMDDDNTTTQPIIEDIP